jgi:hypothetical protein
MKTIQHKETLYYYDGAQVFEARDGIGGHYVAVMVEPDGTQDQYVLASVEPERLRQFRIGALDLRSLLTERGDEEWFLAKVNGDLDAPLALQPQATALAASPYLPEPGFLLYNSPANGEPVSGHDSSDCAGASGTVKSSTLGSQKILRKLSINVDNGDYPALETAFKEAGIEYELLSLMTLSSSNGDHKVFWVGLAQHIHALIKVIVDFAKHKNKRLVLKSGDREFQAENYSAEQLIEILPIAQEAFFRDGGTNDTGNRPLK